MEPIVTTRQTPDDPPRQARNHIRTPVCFTSTPSHTSPIWRVLHATTPTDIREPVFCKIYGAITNICHQKDMTMCVPPKRPKLVLSTMVTMAFLLKLIAIILLLVALFAFYQSWKAKKSASNEGARQRNDPLAFAAGVSGENDFNPQVIGPGAILSRGGIDYVVRGTVTLSQGPFVWYEHMIDGGSGSLWLSVEVDEGQLELVLWNPRKDLNLDPHATIEVDGVTYREIERGGARYTTEGTTGLPAAGDMSYVDYEGPNGMRLGLEKYGPTTPWEATIGQVVTPGEFTVFPAPPAQ